MIRQPMFCYRPKKQQQLDIAKLRYPLYVSPKIDAFRALISPETNVISRSLTPFPNGHVQRTFGFANLIGFDGEIVAGEPTAPDVFLRTQTACMDHTYVEKDLRYYVFDYYLSDKGFRDRLAKIVYAERRKNVIVVNQALVNHHEEALELFEDYCKQGYEGIILRNPNGLYKQGRSTLNEQYLLKYKPFHDSEAEILDFEEMVRKDGTIAKGLMGRIKLRDIVTKQVFWAGSGAPFFNDEGRKKYWAIRKQLLKRVVKYRCQLSGGKEAPRFPRTLAFRDTIDL
jgi:DNA ligase-1